LLVDIIVSNEEKFQRSAQ